MKEKSPFQSPLSQVYSQNLKQTKHFSPKENIASFCILLFLMKCDTCQFIWCEN